MHGFFLRAVATIDARGGMTREVLLYVVLVHSPDETRGYIGGKFRRHVGHSCLMSIHRTRHLV